MTSSAFARGIATIVGVGSKPGGINCVGGFGKKKKKKYKWQNCYFFHPRGAHLLSSSQSRKYLSVRCRRLDLAAFCGTSSAHKLLIPVQPLDNIWALGCICLSIVLYWASVFHLHTLKARCLNEGGSVRRYYVSSIRSNSLKVQEIVSSNYRGWCRISVCICCCLLTLVRLLSFLSRPEENNRVLREEERRNGAEAFQSKLGGDVTSCKQVFGVKNQETASREPRRFEYVQI